GLSIGERAAEADGHVPSNERRRRVEPRHAGADVERLVPTERREEVGVTVLPALAVFAVAGRALLLVETRALLAVRGGRILDALEPPPRCDARGDAAGDEPDVREDGDHVVARGVERGAVHAALEAVVHSLLDGIDFSAAGPVLGEDREQADPRTCV